MRKELQAAISIAQEAGSLLADFFSSEMQDIQKKIDASLVTDADFASHNLIKERLLSTFPNHTFFSEESPDALERSIGPEPTWVVDPLDGTSNFVARMPLFATVLTLVENREPTVAVIYDPVHNELFAASKGRGTTLNGEPVSVSKRQTTKGAMLFAGRGYRDRDHKRHGEIIYELEQQTTYFRRLGSAAIMLSSVASGRADAVILTGNKPWDVLAGALLIQEAGGQITDYCGRPWSVDSEDLVATNGKLHGELTAITKEKEGTC